MGGREDLFEATYLGRKRGREGRRGRVRETTLVVLCCSSCVWGRCEREEKTEGKRRVDGKSLITSVLWGEGQGRGEQGQGYGEEGERARF
jgi:hypothetical protein